MINLSFSQPLLNRLLEEVISELLTPDGAIGLAHLGQGGIEVEQSNQTWPLSGPVGNSENGTYQYVRLRNTCKGSYV